MLCLVCDMLQQHAEVVLPFGPLHACQLMGSHHERALLVLKEAGLLLAVRAAKAPLQQREKTHCEGQSAMGRQQMPASLAQPHQVASTTQRPSMHSACKAAAAWWGHQLYGMVSGQKEQSISLRGKSAPLRHAAGTAELGCARQLQRPVAASRCLPRSLPAALRHQPSHLHMFSMSSCAILTYAKSSTTISMKQHLPQDWRQ